LKTAAKTMRLWFPEHSFGTSEDFPMRTTISVVSSSKTVFSIVLVAALSTSCGLGSASGGATDDASGEPAAGSSPTPDELANATYRGVLDHPVTLVDGRWEGEPFVEGGASRPTVGLGEGFLLTGDLTGDGRDEAVVLLWEASGGSGTRTHLAVVGRQDGGVANLGTSLVGDRIQVRTGFIVDGVITLDVIRAGPGDAACCPTEKALIGWRLEDGSLTQIAISITGVLSLEDLRGPVWTLVAIGPDGQVSDHPQIDIQFSDDRVEGSGGCNEYFGTVTGEAPGKLSFSAMGTTMMACPEPVMDLERRYLHTLADGSSYSFVGGRLVIGCETDDGPVSLVFERLSDAPPATDDEP
jgi:heat shock protein HslJ